VIQNSEPAWLLYSNEGCVLAGVHARSPARAIKRGYKDYGINEGGQLRVIRWTAGDRAYPDPISQAELITEHYLTLQCAECDYPIDDLMFDFRTNKPLTPVFNDDAQKAFCREACLLAYDRAHELEYH